MILTVELTLYPLKEDYIPPIKAVIEHINAFPGVKVETVPTATIVTGDYDHVMDVVKGTVAWSYERFGRCVFIAKFLPAYEAIS